MTFAQGFAIGLLVGAPLGYLIGTYVERLGWNRLIQTGVLPKPRSKS